MTMYKLIKTRGRDGAKIGYYIPRVYRLVGCWPVVKALGFPYVKERLTGWTIWWTESEIDYWRAIKNLQELKKTHKFEFMVSK